MTTILTSPSSSTSSFSYSSNSSFSSSSTSSTMAATFTLVSQVEGLLKPSPHQANKLFSR